jgi:predicted transcriptional regulator YdeE|tara:strand:+ start:156 stop:626 length:471 start_codon:yes stop_codon:yes gene_type:complete
MKNMQTVKIEPFKIIGLSIRTTNENGQATKDIADLWGKFMAENTLAMIPNKITQDIYSLYTDYEDDHTKPYTTILGCKVSSLDKIPEGMVGRSFDGGSYVKTSTKGDLMQGLIVKHWSKIFEMNLNRTYIADFEIYGKKAQNPSAAEVDIYLGVNQ